MNYIKENDYVKNSFTEFFVNNGFKMEESIALNSKIDSSVFLVGSCTNVFKQYFLNRNIHNHGHVLVQPSINSKYLSNLYDSDMPRYASSYMTLGNLCRYQDLQLLLKLTFQYLYEVLGFDSSLIELKLNEKDNDYTEALDKMVTNEKVSYHTGDNCRNHFGTTDAGEEIKGRTLKIAVSRPQNSKSNSMLIISVYEILGQIYGVELSTTASIINVERFTKDNTMQVSTLNQIEIANSNDSLKYYECISVIADLLRCGITPNSSKMDGRIFNKYNQALAFLSDKVGRDLSASLEFIKNYSLFEYKQPIELTDDQIYSKILKR
jgi:hypothetical protein